MPTDRRVLLGTLSAIVGASLFGMLGPLSRFGADAGVEGIAFTAWRALLGAIALVVLIGARGRLRASLEALRSLPGGQRRALAVASVAGLVLNASIFTAFGLVPIALALVLFYAYPAGVAVVDLALGRERLTVPRLVALALASVGVVIVLAGGLNGDAGPIEPLGVALGLTAAAAQVVFVTVSRDGYRSVPADLATVVILVTAVVGASGIAFVADQVDGLVAPFRAPDAWPALLPAGVLAAGASSLLFLTAIRLIGGTRTGILMLLEPVVGVALAAAWLGEAVGPVQVLGGLLVLAGAVVLQLRAEPALPPIAEEGAAPVA